MQITVKLLAGYRCCQPERDAEPAGAGWVVLEAARVNDVLADLPIPPGSIYTFFVNGRHAERDQVLQDGDELSVFPAVGGGL